MSLNPNGAAVGALTAGVRSFHPQVPFVAADCVLQTHRRRVVPGGAREGRRTGRFAPFFPLGTPGSRTEGAGPDVGYGSGVDGLVSPPWVGGLGSNWDMSEFRLPRPPALPRARRPVLDGKLPQDAGRGETGEPKPVKRGSLAGRQLANRFTCRGKKPRRTRVGSAPQHEHTPRPPHNGQQQPHRGGEEPIR